jgi:hypothetical protein
MTEQPVRTRVRLQKIYLVACEKGKFLMIGNIGEPCAVCGEYDAVEEVGEVLVEWENDGKIVVHGSGFAAIEEGT